MKYIIVILSILFVLLIYVLISNKLNFKRKKTNIKDYKNYSEFLGNIQISDKNYQKKINTIIRLINKVKLRNIKEIAKLSDCSYDECILKIKFLKKQKVIDNYYIDEQNGFINLCSVEDINLIEKYSPFIYTKHLQLEYIARSLPQTTLENLEEVKKQILKDLVYLDKKDLLNGINIDLVDEKIIYYDVEKLKKNKDYISINCESCGALCDVPRKGKARCEYCDRIIEDKSLNN